MDDFCDVIVAALASIGLYACGLNWQLIILWFVLMVIDIVTGNIKHAVKGTWCSKDMKLGLIKKAGEFFLLVALIFGQKVFELSGVKLPAGEVFAGIFAIKELGSIIENCIQMGVKVPKAVMKWFRVAQGNKEDDDNV